MSTEEILPVSSVSLEERKRIGKKFVERYHDACVSKLDKYKAYLQKVGAPSEDSVLATCANYVTTGAVSLATCVLCGCFAGGAASGAGNASKSAVSKLSNKSKKKNAKSIVAFITGKNALPLKDSEEHNQQQEKEFNIFIKAGAHIFQLYEKQIVKIYKCSEEQSDEGNLQKLAEDAAHRGFQFMKECAKQGTQSFNEEVLVEGIVLGTSSGQWKTSFPYPISTQVRPGKTIKMKDEKVFQSTYVFQEIEVVGAGAVSQQRKPLIYKQATDHGTTIHLGGKWYSPKILQTHRKISGIQESYFGWKNWKYLINEDAKNSIIISATKTLKDIEKEKRMPGGGGTESPAAPTPPIKSSVRFEVSDPIPSFVGRNDELQKLKAWKLHPGYKSFLISGIGGNGKTQLCKKFIKTLTPETNVTWFGGDTAQQLTESITKCCSSLSLIEDASKNSLPIEALIQSVAKFIAPTEEKPWLVVIDNVDEEYPEFLPAVKQLKKDALVLVTSCKTNILPSDSVHLPLPVLNDTDSWQLVNSWLDDLPQDQVHELCETLQHYPLALQQAIAYIKFQQNETDSGYSVADYIQDFNADKQEAFDQGLRFSGYDRTMSTVFRMTLTLILKQKGVEHAKKKSTLHLVLIMSLVHPDGIFKRFLMQLFANHAKYNKGFSEVLTRMDKNAETELSQLFEASLKALKCFSLVSVHNRLVSIHRVTQKMMIVKMKEENTFESVVDALLVTLTDSVESMSKEEILHVLHIWNITTKLPKLIKKHSNFAIIICNRLNDLSLYREILNVSENNFKIFSEILGPDHKDTLRIESCLASALEQNGEYEESLIKSMEVWEKQKKVFGEENEETLITANDIVSALSDLDRHEESLEWSQRLLKSRIKVHGENHKYTMNTKNNMAVVLNAQGKSKEALSIYKQVLVWQEKELGHQHPHTLNTRHNIATCLYEQGKLVEAKEELKEVLELKVKMLGEEHADTFYTKYWLSLTLYSLGQKEEGLEMMKEVLFFRERILGPNHPCTIDARDTVLKWQCEI